MDETVLRAMAKWPDVPAVYGWLRLDRRGRWLIAGEEIRNQAANAFIGRNYAGDDDGNWYFQNGPQQVFVDLDYTPWVLRLQVDGGLHTHVGKPVNRPRRGYVDEQGNLLIEFESGVALAEDRDLNALADRLCGLRGEPMQPEAVVESLAAVARGEACQMGLRLNGEVLETHGIRSDSVPARFGFNRRPRAPDSVSQNA